MANQPVPQTADISIHALREESDATLAALRPLLTISIHALREESDQSLKGKVELNGYFNPRSP